MNKKIICLALSLMLICTASMAFAGSSKTTGDLTTGTTGSGSVLGADVPVLGVEPMALTKDAEAELAAIAAFIAGGQGVVGYFGEAVQAQILALLPAGTDASKLVMNELISAKVENYDLTMGDVSMYFTFATAYKEGTTLVVLVGVKNGDSVTWIPLKAEVVNGLVKVNFTQQALSICNGREIMLAVLSEDTAQ